MELTNNSHQQDQKERKILMIHFQMIRENSHPFGLYLYPHLDCFCFQKVRGFPPNQVIKKTISSEISSRKWRTEDNIYSNSVGIELSKINDIIKENKTSNIFLLNTEHDGTHIWELEFQV